MSFSKAFSHFKGVFQIILKARCPHFRFMRFIKKRTLILAVIIKLVGVASVERINMFAPENHLRGFASRFQICGVTV